jgi:hypothetical protein
MERSRDTRSPANIHAKSRHSPVTSNLLDDLRSRSQTNILIRRNETRCYPDSEIETRFTTNYWLNLIFTVQSTESASAGEVKSKRRSQQTCSNCRSTVVVCFRRRKTDLFSPILLRARTLRTLVARRDMKTELELWKLSLYTRRQAVEICAAFCSLVCWLFLLSRESAFIRGDMCNPMRRLDSVLCVVRLQCQYDELNNTSKKRVKEMCKKICSNCSV